ncbi:hypothetical protein [Alienimonas sp. DA493]|uniref:hypothetical protein n=1 Tax=Alienimonas sp. DA493 TaxID=3373605 RepID=UPI0037548DDA
MSAPPPRPLRVLHVGQDDLFAAVEGVERRFVPTGHSITPAAAGRGPLSPASLRSLLVGLGTGPRWDAIVLPTIQFDWPHDRSRFKRGLRRVAAGVLQRPALGRRLSRWLRRRATVVVALDRFDAPEIAASYLRATPALSACYKTNLRTADVDRRVGDCRLAYLPYWIDADRYPARPVAPEEKDVDLLFVGAVNSPEREEGRRVLASMSDRYRVVVPEERLPFEEYCRLTARAWLTLSPQGYGYHGFRHYEAMLLGSIPVLHPPDPPVVHDFEDGRNCLIYEPGRLRERLEAALADRRQTGAGLEDLRRYALDRHSVPAVGRYLTAELQRLIAGEE